MILVLIPAGAWIAFRDRIARGHSIGGDLHRRLISVQDDGSDELAIIGDLRPEAGAGDEIDHGEAFLFGPARFAPINATSVQSGLKNTRGCMNERPLVLCTSNSGATWGWWRERKATV